VVKLVLRVNERQAGDPDLNEGVATFWIAKGDRTPATLQLGRTYIVFSIRL
jgi:hypothetical protein